MDPLIDLQDDGWRAAVGIIERLRAAGYEAVLAGGCVRDRLLGLTPKDHDVATSAHPTDVLRLYPRARQVGVKFGVVLVRQSGQDVEVATFRSDGPYSDGRRPDHIEFGTARQDAQRRDFTINGLFLDPFSGSVIDYVDGQADLKLGIIRTIGEPSRRFAEDHLRLLRAVRFAARFGFAIEAETRDEIRRSAPRLESISPERVAMEMEAMFCPPTRLIGWRLLCDMSLTQHLVAGWRPSPSEQADVSARLGALPPAPAPFALCLACLWANHLAPTARTFARELRCSNRDARTVTWLLSRRAELDQLDQLDLAALKRIRGDRDWPLLAPFLDTVFAAEARDPATLRHFLGRVAAIPEDRIAPPPLLSGEDLLALGSPPGRALGMLVDRLYTAQLNEEVNDRVAAEQLVRKWLASPG